MADKVTVKQTLVLNAEFADGDTRTISVDNAIDNITIENIKTLETVSQNVLIGDQNGSSFSSFKGAAIRKVTTQTYDLTT